MSSSYTVISRIHRQVDACRAQLANERGLLWWLDRALTHDELGPHPDDLLELDAMLEADAGKLRELAHELEMRRIEIKRNALQYQLAAE